LAEPRSNPIANVAALALGETLRTDIELLVLRSTLLFARVTEMAKLTFNTVAAALSFPNEGAWFATPSGVARGADRRQLWRKVHDLLGKQLRLQVLHCLRLRLLHSTQHASKVEHRRALWLHVSSVVTSGNCGHSCVVVDPIYPAAWCGAHLA
jgi:hypothetical protein